MHLTGQIVLLMVAVGYVHACGRPDSVKPFYDPNNGAVGVKANWKFKRSTEHAGKLHHLNSETGPCRFIVYDSNSGGAILSGEMYALFEDMQDTKRRFLDSITGDHIISLKEINGMAPKIIYSCAPPETTDYDAPEQTSLDAAASKETDA